MVSQSSNRQGEQVILPAGNTIWKLTKARHPEQVILPVCNTVKDVTKTRHPERSASGGERSGAKRSVDEPRRAWGHEMIHGNALSLHNHSPEHAQ
jgi:hypothetical protein